MAERTRPTADRLAVVKKRIVEPGSNPWVRACFYGANGSGKTRLAASLPKTLLIDVNEEGDRSVKGRRGVRVYHARKWEDIGDVYWYLHQGNHPFEGFAIDTITQMNVLALSFVMGEAEARDPTREKSMPDKRTWGRAGELMKGMLLAYRNLPMHCVFTAQERRIRDQDTEELLEITVDLPGSSRGTAMSCVGILGRMVPKEIRVKSGGKVKRQWRDHLDVAESEIVQTKDRTYSLGPVLRDPTMPKIVEAWQDNPPKEDEY